MTAEQLPRKMTAGDVMTSQVITATAETPIKTVAELLLRHRISGIPVVDPEGRVVGIVTEADLLLGKEATIGERFASLAAPIQEHRALAKARAETAGEAMSSPAVTIDAETPLAAAARLMRKHRVKRLPVIDADQHLIGIVSRYDILTTLARPDAEIRREIVEGVLPRWLGVDPAQLDVDVEDGVVTLRGELERRSEVLMLGRFVEGLDGVVAVRSELSFRWDDSEVRPTPERPLE